METKYLKNDHIHTECLQTLRDRVFVTDLLLKLKEYSPATFTHSVSVANMSYDIAKQLVTNGNDKITKEQVCRLYVAALLHDIGKLNISKKLLEHKGPLNLEEKREMRNHVEETKKIMTDKFDEETIKLACSHHERLNGSGYGLTPNKPRDIRTLKTLERILAVADVTCAMLEDRSYQNALSPQEAAAALKEMVAQNELDKTVVNTVTKGLGLERNEDEKTA